MEKKPTRRTTTRKTNNNAAKKPAAKKRMTKKQLEIKQRNIIVASVSAIAVLVVALIVTLVVTNNKNDVAVILPATNNTTENATITSDTDDISALIRQVLFDNEVSRTAVSERMTSTANGDKIIYINIKEYDESKYDNIQNILKSVLMRKGYQVQVDNKILIASAYAETIEVSFASDDKGDIVYIEPPLTTPTVKLDNPPTPPAKSDIVVKMAILLDDGGFSIPLTERFVQINYPITLAILPNVPYTKETARLVSAYNKSIFLHFPMQPKSYPKTDPGEGAALLNMPEILIGGVTKQNMESIGVPIDGVNNHMGSAITEDRTKMAQIMTFIKPYTNVFVDSRTTADTVAYDECMKAGMACGMNRKFLDNENDINYIIGKIYEAAEYAKKHGEVIAIGHLRENTLTALEYALPILEELNIAVVPVTTLVR